MELAGDCVMASRQRRSRRFAHRTDADADGEPHPCRHARKWKNVRRPYSNCCAAIERASRRTHSNSSASRRRYDLNLWRAFGVFLEGWGSAASGASGSGLEDMRCGVELLREQNVLMFDGLVKIALAEAEAPGGRDFDRAVAILDEALATCDRLGNRTFEAELHRARGEILLKRDPSDAANAEEAFLTGVAVAKQQGTRSFRTARGAAASQALSFDRTFHRGARGPRACAGRLFRRRQKCLRSLRRKRCSMLWRRPTRSRPGPILADSAYTCRPLTAKR